VSSAHRAEGRDQSRQRAAIVMAVLARSAIAEFTDLAPPLTPSSGIAQLPRSSLL
jgi:hypothetical protein